METDLGATMRVSISEASRDVSLHMYTGVLEKLTRSVDTERVTSKAEDLSTHRVNGRLRQALEFANVLTEPVDDLLDMLQHSYSMLSQLTVQRALPVLHTSCQNPRGSRRRSAS